MGEEMKDIIGGAQDKNKDKVERSFRFHPETSEYIEKEAERRGINAADVVEELLSGNVAIVSFEETATGKAKLEFKSWSWTGSAVSEKPEDRPKIIEEYRYLRDNFEPVTAGINFHKKFATGGGMRVQIEDPRDEHQLEAQRLINEFNRNIYQDYLTRGLDRILNILVDDSLTVGGSAAEIVYEKEFEFSDFVINEIEIPNPDAPEEEPKKFQITRMPKNSEWKKFGGIKKLKIINNAIDRLVPHRHPLTYEIMYWTLDEVKPTKTDFQKAVGKEKEKKKEPKKFLPWQIFWLSWNTRGTDLIGQSIIKPVLVTARLVKEIKEALGKGYRRWANKKYFFVCGSERRPWGKADQREFMVALAHMLKQNWSGIPVPQGFDVKDIGGEIFDSRNLLDYLTGMICTGMTYPRDFLEQGRTRASDKAWLAWQVTYGEAQLQIRRAIEHQLWEKHLWCKLGVNRRIPKQGVKKKKQEIEHTFVPKVEWRSESKWHMTERLNMDVQILNVANPVGPQLKLAVERDIAKTMGWGDVILPTFTELERELKIMEKQILLGMTDDKQKKRLDKGVSKKKSPTGEDKKPPPSAGGTRQPNILTGTQMKKFIEGNPDLDTTDVDILEQSQNILSIKKIVDTFNHEYDFSDVTEEESKHFKKLIKAFDKAISRYATKAN